jgi:hypothetical protein
MLKSLSKLEQLGASVAFGSLSAGVWALFQNEVSIQSFPAYWTIGVPPASTSSLHVVAASEKLIQQAL